ncbi:MAG: 3-phosphoshikimate 1-carboxyvinyltransferase [Vicinamibacterales bacterium]
MTSRAVTVQPTARVRGRIRLPGDKSISHRYALLGALATGTTTIDGYSTGGDCASTLRCLEGLGVEIDRTGSPSGQGLTVTIVGRGLGGLRAPDAPLDAGNSGSTMRMLSGILAAHPFTTVVSGDASLTRRPMRRVIVPLEQMGASIASVDGRPPLTITGRRPLRAMAFVTEVPSAQVKSAVLLAGLHADGTTSVTEAIATRDHTELALATFGVAVQRAGTTVSVAGGQPLAGRRLTVPGDISSAAFWMVAAAALPDSDVTIEGVGLNPSRTAIIDVLRRMGAIIDVTPSPSDAAEPVGTIRVRHGGFTRAEITPDEVPGVIDELPVLAALASLGGELVVSGAQELRVKESDRITSLADGLRRLGASIEERPDGFHVRGGRLAGGTADAIGDHRLAMAFSIAALGATGPSTIEDAGAADVSYPEFFTILDSLRA